MFRRFLVVLMFLAAGLVGAQYQNYNFSRSSAGERISFSAAGISFQLGLSVNF